MIKKICFFSTGFAFNRSNRLKYYEKIFLKDIEMFLFTTNKYGEKKNYLNQWDLKSTKIIKKNYNPITLPFKLRKFLKENKIESVVNLGNWAGCLLLFLSTLFMKTKYMMNIMADIIPKNVNFLEKIFRAIIFYPLVVFSERVIFNDEADYERHKKIFGNKVKYLPATVNTDLFISQDKTKTRRKLKLSSKKKIVIFVGRIDYTKGSDLLIDLIKKNEDILFIVIGRIIDKSFNSVIKSKNVLYFEKKSSEELVDYYNSADLGYFPQRIAGGLGMTTAECLACGIPAINRPREGIKDSPALFKTPVNIERANKEIQNFLKLNKEERERLRKIARKYAEENYSQKAWQENYIRYYLD